MGNIAAKAVRPLKNINLERRVDKYLDVDKHKVSPKPSSYEKPQLNAEQENDLFEKNPELVQGMGEVQIKSLEVTDGVLPSGVTYGIKSKRPLPQKFETGNPFIPPHKEFGFIIPDIIPKGRMTLKQVIAMLKANQVEKKSYAHLADEYGISVQNAEYICTNFKLLLIASTKTGTSLIPPYLMKELELNLLESQEFEDPNAIQGLGGLRKVFNKNLQKLPKLQPPDMQKSIKPS
ncbi:hypothetical protein Ciccas_009287 [Cichlidogyrus casuarinus]|uniref:NADH dehydrogenase [ubiquinone] 1 alpha subcomplex assembly factor 4 n=1 Tax=Cichlidogyrus casuarinus TaxID=1844966 RepID=A0ABD2PXH4_9PLAT